MKTRTKVALAVLCALLLVTVSILGTVAYLTSKTTVVTNTFTAGNVTITLDETDVDVYGVKDSETRVTENGYKLIPGHTYVKDPIIHVGSGSEDCYLFVKITDEIAAIQDTTTIGNQLTANGWALVDDETDVYYYNNKVSAGANIEVFENFKIKSDADVSAYAGKTITVQAYAVQADGFADAAAAWEDAPCTWGVNP